MNTFNSPLGGVFAGFLSYGKEYKMKKNSDGIDLGSNPAVRQRRG